MLPYVEQNPAQVEHVQGHVLMPSLMTQETVPNTRMGGQRVDGVVVVVIPPGVHLDGALVQKAVGMVRKVETYHAVQPMVLNQEQPLVIVVMEP